MLSRGLAHRCSCGINTRGGTCSPNQYRPDHLHINHHSWALRAAGEPINNIQTSPSSSNNSSSPSSTQPAARVVAAALGGVVALQLLFPCSSLAMSPYEEAKQMVYGPTADGRIRACPSNVNPNCVSTGSINDTYSPAWRSTEASPAAAAQFLEQVVTSTLEGSKLLKSMSLQSGAEYRAFGVPSLFGEDVVEFIIKPESVTDRNWEGDAPGQLVTYRSMAGSVKYIWPIQQPVSDFDAQRKRLKQIRDEIGWPIIGCELLECYQ